MPRRRRLDAPGRLHHIGNGGHHGDPLFILHPDFERFLEFLTEAVEADRIRVHAAVFMTTHFHLLVESLDGAISRTIQWITGRYGQYYNRARHLAGYVHQARFWSAPIQCRAHLLSVIPYIDWNPVAARMVDGPFLHAYGSAVHHTGDEERPPWLCGDIVDQLIGPEIRSGLGRTEAYIRTFGLGRRPPPGYALVEARLAHPSRARDDLDWLLSADGRRVRAGARITSRFVSCVG